MILDCAYIVSDDDAADNITHLFYWMCFEKQGQNKQKTHFDRDTLANERQGDIVSCICQNSIKRYAHIVDSFVWDVHNTQGHKTSIDWSLHHFLFIIYYWSLNPFYVWINYATPSWFNRISEVQLVIYLHLDRFWSNWEYVTRMIISSQTSFMNTFLYIRLVQVDMHGNPGLDVYICRHIPEQFLEGSTKLLHK